MHRISVDAGGYFASRGVAAFYPEAAVTFEVTDAAAHYHVPLLLRPFAFSTCREGWRAGNAGPRRPPSHLCRMSAGFAR